MASNLGVRLGERFKGQITLRYGDFPLLIFLAKNTGIDPAVLAALHAKDQQARTPLASCRRVFGVNGLSGTGAGGDILPAVHRTRAHVGKFSKQGRLTGELGAEPVKGVVVGHWVG
jgi:hypothetical protein